MKIAVASVDGLKVDQHFGRASHFYVYEICEGMAMAEGARPVNPYCTNAAGHEFENSRLLPVLEMLSDCRYLFVEKIGDAPKHALEAAGIHTTQTNAFVHEILRNITGGSHESTV